MDSKTNYIQDLQEIRSMMERSSRFLSLSGLAGVFAGCFALIGAYLVYRELGIGQEAELTRNSYHYTGKYSYTEALYFMVSVALSVLMLSLAAGVFFTTRKARKQQLQVWDHSAKRLLVNLFIPLVTGGLFCLILISHGLIGLLAPATLIFYGLALLNGSKYTLTEIRYLGITEILLGLLATLYIGYGLYFWAFGFGVLHIFYGTLMYFKYERNS